MKNPRVCKCGHSKDEHYKQPKTWKSIISECNKCKCSDYVNRKKTGKIDTILGIFLSGMCILFLFTVGLPMSFLNDEVKVPIGLFGIILTAMMILLILHLLPNMTLSYFEHKRRKTYEIEP